MTQTLSVTASDVVKRCQRHVKLLEPGSEAAEVTEHAISLALSPNRPEKQAELLLGDVLRDARRTVVRSKSRHLRLVSEVGRFAEQGISTGAVSGYSDHETPEQRVLARALLELLRTRAQELGGAAPRVLAGLLVDETELETAEAAAVSRSTVTRVRRSLREFSAEQGYCPIAA
jgi:hypothetical protein